MNDLSEPLEIQKKHSRKFCLVLYLGGIGGSGDRGTSIGTIMILTSVEFARDIAKVDGLHNFGANQRAFFFLIPEMFQIEEKKHKRKASVWAERKKSDNTLQCTYIV
jgi:hypothetical protein